MLAEDLTDEEKGQKIVEIRDGLLRKFLNICEKQLESQGVLAKFLVGDNMTIADFVVSALFFNIIKNENGPFTQVLSQIIPEFPFLISYE